MLTRNSNSLRSDKGSAQAIALKKRLGMSTFNSKKAKVLHNVLKELEADKDSDENEKLPEFDANGLMWQSLDTSALTVPEVMKKMIMPVNFINHRLPVPAPPTFSG